MAKAPHHQGTFHRRSAALRAAAYANPETRCWKCGRTLAQARRIKPRARWVAGHVNPGQIDGELRAECSICSNAEGGRLRSRRRTAPKFRTSRRW